VGVDGVEYRRSRTEPDLGLNGPGGITLTAATIAAAAANPGAAVPSSSSLVPMSPSTPSGPPRALPAAVPNLPNLAPTLALALALALIFTAPPSAAQPARGTPFTPASDAQVIERLPLRASDAAERELAALREAQRRDPADPARAVELARRYYERATAWGDPRWVGYAQSVLAPWWNASAPPPAVRVMRAVLRQYGHAFEPALADLAAAVEAEPDNVEAWAWRAAIHMVQARYAEARRDCERLLALATPLLGTACAAQVDAATGRAAPAAAALRAALAQAGSEALPEERLWALTRLAETEERRGEQAAAEAAFRAALALGVDDVYLLAAYADFLLDRGRPREVLALLEGKGRADPLLLRLALAARAAGDTAAAQAHQRELAARFDAARVRGDALHEKEEARFVLAFGGDVRQALALARNNFELQREPADARVLLEAALAARDRAGAQPALGWLADSGIESGVLRALARQVEALP